MQQKSLLGLHAPVVHSGGKKQHLQKTALGANYYNNKED